MCYETFGYSLSSEVNHYLKYSDSSKKARKMYKNYKSYWCQELADVWVLVSKAVNEFWSFILKLGPRRSAQIHMKMYRNDNILTNHLKNVHDKWGSDFSALYNKPENIESENNIEFDRNIMNLKHGREDRWKILCMRRN